jgi:hypothetical protein
MTQTEALKLTSPPEIIEIVNQLKHDDIFIGQDQPDVKKPCQHILEEKAIRSVNKVLEELFSLRMVYDDAVAGRMLDIVHAARILEQIQISSADVDRCAFACHLRRANRASIIGQRIACIARELFHELKEINIRRSRKKAA